MLHNRILRSTLHALLGVLSICELLHDSFVVDEISELLGVVVLPDDPTSP